MIQKPYRFFHQVFIPSPVLVDCPNCRKRITPAILPETVKSDEYPIEWKVGMCPVCKAECILPLGFVGDRG